MQSIHLSKHERKHYLVIGLLPTYKSFFFISEVREPMIEILFEFAQADFFSRKVAKNDDDYTENSYILIDEEKD